MNTLIILLQPPLEAENKTKQKQETYNNRSKNNRKTVCRLVSSFVVLGHRIFPDSLFDFSTLFACLPSLAVYSCASPDIVIVGLRHRRRLFSSFCFRPLDESADQQLRPLDASADQQLSFGFEENAERSLPRRLCCPPD